MDSIQTVLNVSLFLMVKPHVNKDIIFSSSIYTQYLTRTAQTGNFRNVRKLIRKKKENLKYHMNISIQTLYCHTHVAHSGAVHFFFSALRWFYTFIRVCAV